jgi:endonuclease/exonuclease/phosphatase family metal-dependent hydrolase
VAKVFTKEEWTRIRRTLDEDPQRFGLPLREYGSAVLGSFNIRKLGTVSGRNGATWDFLADVCQHFDLLAVQEIQDDLDGFRRLKELMGDRFAMIVSDKAGAFPGEAGLGERLGFVYNWSVVTRGDLATDITYDRSKVIRTIARHNSEIHAALSDYGTKLNAYEEKLAEYERLRSEGESPSKPRAPKFKVKMPEFLTFIRPPFCVAFEIRGHPGSKPYGLMAINAHLYFGDYMADRRQEFSALMSWIRARAAEEGKSYYPNFLLLGDLNLDFDSERDRARVEEEIKGVNDEWEGEGIACNFPFLDVHDGQDEPFRTNARLSETFDQIGFFSRDERLPTHDQNASAGRPDAEHGWDYGVFNFVDLFSVALLGRPYAELGEEQKKEFVPRFEHKVSDHMPLWLRLPLP